MINEFPTGRLLTVGLDGSGNVSLGPFGRNIISIHQFEPDTLIDSNEVDGDGNVYVASWGKGIGYVVSKSGELVDCDRTDMFDTASAQQELGYE